jgi:protein SCO1
MSSPRHDRRAVSPRIVLLAVAIGLALALAIAVTLRGSPGRSSPPSPSPSSPLTDSSSSAPPTGASPTSGFDGAALPTGVPAHDFALAEVPSGGRTAPRAGPVVSLSQYRGQATILAFLYSSCGPTCVVIAQQIRGALDELGGRPVPVLLVSADPAVDTSARVHRFLARVSLTGRARWLTGSLAQLRPVWQAYGVIPASAGRAAFDSSASVFLLDRRGRERVLFQSEQLTPEALAHDVRKLW